MRSAGHETLVETVIVYTNVLTLRIVAVAEVILLSVRASEDPISKEVDHNDGDGTDRAKFNRVEGEVTRLKRVNEWHPAEIADGQHEAKTVGRDVHSG